VNHLLITVKEILPIQKIYNVVMEKNNVYENMFYHHKNMIKQDMVINQLE
jgi:hypothetical protein